MGAEHPRRRAGGTARWPVLVPVNYANYNPAWPYLRELISHRELNRCKHCRAPHRVLIWRLDAGPWAPYVRGTPQAAPGRVILCVCSVAHLDWDRTNDHPNNLALLCQRCHLEHDKPQHMPGLRLKRRYSQGLRPRERSL